MKGSKILICGAALIIMHYIDFMLFDKGFPGALLVTAAAGAVCGGVCGESKFIGTAVNTVLTLVLYAALIFMTGRLNIYEQIMFPHGMTEENYLSASNQAAAGLIIMLIFAVTVGSVILGAAVSGEIRNINEQK
ncbi:MAG: hypothetical protein ACI4J0_08330 [Huintestinicola sp.]|uniref:hypothetical protein n=1 Tax=Huintestinicola sp. TaxID=2981661 RepID=UPI003F10085B